MYKKITHTIVEEHFDHPIANQIKKTLEKSKIVTNEVFDEATFKSDVESYFSTYLQNIIEMINASTKTEEDLMIPLERMFKDAWIDEFGNMTKAFYPIEFGEKFNESFRRIALTTFNLVQQIKAGLESRYVSDSFRNVISAELAGVMGNFNGNWNFAVLRPMLDSIGDQIVAMTKARVKKDSAAERLAADELSRLFTEFRQIFVDGLIAQHPERFNRTVTTYKSSSRSDIM